MAQRRLHTLTHQFSIAEELEVLEEEGDISRPLEHDEELWGMSSLAPNLALNDSKACSAMAACQLKHHSMKRSNEADLDGNANRRSDEVSGMSSTPVDSSMLSNQNIDTCVGSYSSMESSEPLLLDSSTSTAEASTPCTYSNGGIQMSISVNNSSNDVNVKDRQALEPLLFTETEDPRFTSNIAAQSTCPHKSAALMSISKSAGSGLTGSENSNQSALLTTPTNCESFKPTNLQVANSQRKLTSVDTIKNRHNFWKARSSSTEVPSSSKQDLLSCGKGSPNLSKLVSTSGPLLRANSLERGTQTVPFSQLNTDEKTQARYGSTISVIGTEYMKAKGVITPKFQQLQKPNIQNHETASHSSRHLNDSSFDKHHSHPSGEVQTAVHMSHKASTQPSHVVRIVPGNEDDMQNKRLAIGYRLGRRKLLAERRRKIADLCCIFALVGLLLMIIQTECSIANIYATVS
ncbi:KCNN2 [Bugula neritina]|uniref:KCNN2 n=1 Tax=Bugula neritina TaxID=10212 RepID=A0A7J7J001_BUGNE|nr:KCNN2 [Bugula neritina]